MNKLYEYLKEDPIVLSVEKQNDKIIFSLNLAEISDNKDYLSESEWIAFKNNFENVLSKDMLGLNVEVDTSGEADNEIISFEVIELL